MPTYLDGKPSGVLAGFIHLNDVSSLLKENDFSKNSYLFMTNEDGTISAHKNEDYVLEKNIDELTNEPKLLSGIQNMNSHIQLGKLEDRFGLISSAPVGNFYLYYFLLLFWIKAEKFAAFGKEMETTANTDKLTGIKNRHCLDLTKLDNCCDEFLTAIFLDIDNFKKFNDLHNHAYGDDVG